MSKIEEFVRLIDVAISRAEAVSAQAARAQSEWLVADAAAAKAQFERLKQQALSGELAPSQGAGLGVSRALGEWAPDDLLDAGVAVENFYRTYL